MNNSSAAQSNSSSWTQKGVFRPCLYSTQWAQECVMPPPWQASKSTFHLVWPWTLTSWPQKLIVSWTTWADLHHIQFLRFQNSVLTDGRTDGQLENIIPPASLKWWSFGPWRHPTLVGKKTWLWPSCSPNIPVLYTTKHRSNKKLSYRSQRDRAMLRIIEYLAKSLRGHSKRHPWVWPKSLLLVFHCNYVCISYTLWDIQC